MTMTAENEFHDLIAKLQAWFRAEAAASTLDALMDHFCTDFSMVGIAGQRLDREALAGMFAGGHGARPGLRIEIDALQFIAVPAPLVVLALGQLAAPCAAAVVTVAVTVQLLGPAARLPPLSAIVLPPTVPLTTPPHWEDDGASARTSPLGKVSVNARPVCALTPLAFDSVNVRETGRPFSTEASPNAFVREGLGSMMT